MILVTILTTGTILVTIVGLVTILDRVKTYQESFLVQYYSLYY